MMQKLAVYLVIGLIGCLAAAGCTSRPASAKVMGAQAELDQAIGLAGSKSYAEAIPHYVSAIDSTLLDGEMLGDALLGRARCYAETGQYELAEQDLAACEQSPAAGSAQEHLVRGILYSKQGKVVEANEAFARAKELEPELPIPQQ